MAEIQFTIAEIVDLIVKNKLMPKQISNIHFEGDFLSFNFPTGLLFPKYIPSTIQFLNYDKGLLTLKIKTNWMSDKFLKIIPLEDNEFIEFKFPRVFVKLQDFLTTRLKGIQNDKIIYDNGMFYISTRNL